MSKRKASFDLIGAQGSARKASFDLASSLNYNSNDNLLSAAVCEGDNMSQEQNLMNEAPNNNPHSNRGSRERRTSFDLVGNLLQGGVRVDRGLSLGSLHSESHPPLQIISSSNASGTGMRKNSLALPDVSTTTTTLGIESRKHSLMLPYESESSGIKSRTHSLMLPDEIESSANSQDVNITADILTSASSAVEKKDAGAIVESIRNRSKSEIDGHDSDATEVLSTGRLKGRERADTFTSVGSSGRIRSRSDSLGSTRSYSRRGRSDTLGSILEAHHHVTFAESRGRSDTFGSLLDSDADHSADFRDFRTRADSVVSADFRDFRSRADSIASVDFRDLRNRADTVGTLGSIMSMGSTGGGFTDEMAALAASALQFTGLIDDVTAAAANMDDSSTDHNSKDATSIPGPSRRGSIDKNDGTLPSNELQKIVQSAIAAVSNLGDDLGDPPTVTSGSASENDEKFRNDSIISLSEVIRENARKGSISEQAAMAAATAARMGGGDINYASIANISLPLKHPGQHIASTPANKSVNGRVTIPSSSVIPNNNMSSVYATPLLTKDSDIHGHTRPTMTPATVGSNYTASSNYTNDDKGQSNQKWDEMFDCLLMYIEERRRVECKGDPRLWTWDGNVPTNFKTKDGRSLGRWVNNQRSAKNKGNLKYDRQEKLEEVGLKWSVLATNTWPDMIRELKIYITEKTKDGKKWDGNVPTNYKIKANLDDDGNEMDEEKNLGRWINRQRSLFQANRLRPDRQAELEQLGLKWSVLSTTSWETMYDALCNYVYEKRTSDSHNAWDGNVPANYKTKDQKNLGRWVNRQRSYYAKGKLKREYVEQLEKIGLKWAVHEKKPVMFTPSPFGNQLPKFPPFMRPPNPAASVGRVSVSIPMPGVPVIKKQKTDLNTKSTDKNSVPKKVPAASLTLPPPMRMNMPFRNFDPKNVPPPPFGMFPMPPNTKLKMPIAPPALKKAIPTIVLSTSTVKKTESKPTAKP